MASIFVMSSYIARNGIEIIARISEFLGPIYILAVVLIGLLIIPFVDIDKLQPQLERGFYPMILNSPFVLTFFGICIIMAMFIPLCNRPENGFIAKFTAVSLGAFFLGIVVILTIIIFSLKNAQITFAPIYQITRLLNAVAEPVWLSILIGAGILASAMMIWAFSLGVSQIIGLSTYKPLVYPAGFIVLVLSLNSFQNNVELMHYVQHTFPVIALLVEGVLEILLFVLALALNKHGYSIAISPIPV